MTADRCLPCGPRWRRLLSLDLFRSLSKETHLQKPVDVGITTLLALLLGFMWQTEERGGSGPLESPAFAAAEGPSVSLLLHQEGQTDRHWVLFELLRLHVHFIVKLRGMGFLLQMYVCEQVCGFCPGDGTREGTCVHREQRVPLPESLGVSGAHRSLCISDPGLHADAVLVSPPPNMEEVDSEDARHPRTPARLQHPFPPTRGEGQPQHRPPLQDGKASDRTPLLLLLREHSALGPSLDQLVISDAPGAPPSVTLEPDRAAGQPGLSFPRRGQVLSSAGVGPQGGLSAPGPWAPAASLPEGGELVEGVPEERRLPLGLG